MSIVPEAWSWDQNSRDFPRRLRFADNHPSVWLATLTEDPGTLARLNALLSAAERERLARFRVRADQLRFLLGRGLLRTFLGAHLGVAAEQVEFQHGPFGKPALAPPAGPPALQFNVSHSGQLVLLAFHASRAVGVDVEALQPEFEWSEVARRVFPPETCARLARLQPQAGRTAFYQAWTRQEAGLKAAGHGFGEPAGVAREPRPSVFDLPLPAGYHGAAALL